MIRCNSGGTTYYYIDMFSAVPVPSGTSPAPMNLLICRYPIKSTGFYSKCAEVANMSGLGSGEQDRPLHGSSAGDTCLEVSSMADYE